VKKEERMSEEEGGAEDVSFLRTEDMVCLSCTGQPASYFLNIKGIVSRDWGGLLMVSVDR
jgi:hypothetical protein